MAAVAILNFQILLLKLACWIDTLILSQGAFMPKRWAIIYILPYFFFLTGFNRHFDDTFCDVECWNEIENAEKAIINSNSQVRENLIETVTVTVLQALNRKMAVVTSSNMLISHITIAIFYNELMNYEHEDNMFSRINTSIGQAET